MSDQRGMPIDRRALIAGGGGALLLPAAASAEGCSRFGRYVGRLQTQWEPGMGKFRAVRAVTFIEPCGQRWPVPAGAVFTGESIPGFLWVAIGSPLKGLFQDATLFHDYYCSVRTRPAAAVHTMFYEALLASGVAAWTAGKFYFGVKLGGPSWDELQVANARLAAAPRGFSLVRPGAPRAPGLHDSRLAGSAPMARMAAPSSVRPSSMGSTAAAPPVTRSFRLSPSTVAPTSIAPPPAIVPPIAGATGGTTVSSDRIICEFAGNCGAEGGMPSVGTGGDRALAEARLVVDRNQAAADQFEKLASGMATGPVDLARLDAAAAAARATIERTGWSPADRLAWDMAGVGAPR